MTDPVLASGRPAGDKREAILRAALRLIARAGLHDAPMAAVAREAGVAAGTPYVYFASKEAMINALYLDVLQDRDRVLVDAAGRAAAAAEDSVAACARSWYALAHWELDHPDASNFLLQCQTSGILTEETREVERRLAAAGREQFTQAVHDGVVRALPLPVFWALFVGPIHLLAQMRAAGELAITDDVLRETFEGVRRSVLSANGDGDPHRAVR